MSNTPAPAPGAKTSEWKLALFSVGAVVATWGLKAIGVAALATGQWWAIPVSLAVTSAGYSLSRGLAKQGVLPVVPGPVTAPEPLRTSGV